jgi:hypothetical protein
LPTWQNPLERLAPESGGKGAWEKEVKKRLRIIGIVFGIIAGLVIGGGIYYKTKFPYGQSHCCSKGMMFALEQFAEENSGRYPAGESCPEASLSLLCRSNYLDAYTLRGMIVPEKTVRGVLDSGGLLGPDSCGWHYTDGLTRADDTRIALVYCKQPLGHNGDKTKDGGREVVFVGGNIEWISGNKWAAFLEGQRELLSKRTDRAKTGAPLVDAVIELPDGSHVESLDTSYTLQEKEAGADNSSGNGTSSGSSLNRDSLAWYNPPLQNNFSGFITRTLSFSNLVSAPVTVTFTNGVPDRTNVVFKMRAKE